MAPGLGSLVQEFNEFQNEIIREAWLPALNNVSFQVSDGKSYLADRIRRNSEDIVGFEVNMPFQSRTPIGWRALNMHGGVTPSGATGAWASQKFELGGHSAAINVTLEEIKAFALTKDRDKMWADIANRRMQQVYEAFPFYLRAQLWASEGLNKALGRQNGAASGNVVTLDNDGFGWGDASAKDYTRLFEYGMYLQPYSSTNSKLGDPVYVTAIDHSAGTITLSDASATEDNCYFVCSDVAGQDVPYSSKCPGIPDVIDDDNTFQNVDRSTAANAWARAHVEDGTSYTLDFNTLDDFFYRVHKPSEAVVHPALLRAYWESQLAEQRRFQSRDYDDGYEYITIGKTRMVESDDVPTDMILVPRLDQMHVAEVGFENLFDQGWYQLPKTTMLEYVLTWIGRLVAKDCRKMAVLQNLSY